jgi:diguanylate cyclase (GGDEF)-like protein/PAS domain S-box-containing protein
MKKPSEIPSQTTMPLIQDPEIYRSILESLRLGICVVDLQKKIIFWNDGAEAITARTRMEVLGHSCLENIMTQCNQTGCTQCTDQCPLTMAMHQGKTVEGGIFIQHKAGHRVPVHSWTVPLRDAHGSIIGAIQSFEEPLVSDNPDPGEESMKLGGFLDAVTGLANHVMMQSHLRETLGTFAELHIPFGVVCVEATELGRFRARYGQDATTSILRAVARTLRNTVWPSDFVGRWSEDQFLVILNGCSQTALQAVVERMRRMLVGATIEWWGEEHTIAVSIGKASAQTGDTVDSLMERASQAVAADRPATLSQAAAPSDSSATS